MILMSVSQDHVRHVQRWLRLNASVVISHRGCSVVVTELGHVDQSVVALWDVGGMHVLKYVIQRHVHPAPRRVSRVVSVVDRKFCDLVLLQIGSVNR
jgi:hypothetical protein